LVKKISNFIPDNFFVMVMKKHIAIVAGGYSREREISLKSAEQVCSQIDKDLFVPYTVDITEKEWIVTGEKFKRGIPVNKDDFSFNYRDKKVRFDCAFIMIHGTPGENGILQGYFEMVGIPYTTSDVLTSALTFSKNATKVYVKSLGILTPKGILIKNDDKIDSERYVKELKLPCFVKPNKSGSSFGITKVTDINDMLNAILKALEEDDEVIVEEYIEGTEITCGVFKTHEETYVFPITEIVSKKEFFDFEAKYTDGMANEITPARISRFAEIDCKILSSYIYEALDCRGVIRVDYILKNDKLYFIEINSIPGMSKNSIVPQQIRAMGMTLKEFFTLLINDTLGIDSCRK